MDFMAILYANNLSKTYFSKNSKEKDFVALQDFCLEINEPTIYGLVGPNGAGKTTFIKHCLGLTKQTSGELEILDQKPFESKQQFLKQISLISGNNSVLEGRLSARELIKLQRALYQLDPDLVQIESQKLITRFKLQDKIDVPLDNLSLGQKMKFEIISKILHKPKVLFMDEPTLGLDFEAQNMMHELILELHKQEKVTILLTSHYMPDIYRLCSKFTVIENGQNVFTGNLETLNQQINSKGYLKSLIEELNKQD
jgi:ABC-2 type transport system ATP-binding protein